MRYLIVGLTIAVYVFLSCAKVSGLKLSLSLLRRSDIGKRSNNYEQLLNTSSSFADDSVVEELTTAILHNGHGAQLDGVPELAVRLTIIDGLLKAIKLMFASGNKVIDAIDKAMFKSDPTEAAQLINKAFNDDLDTIFPAGVFIHNGYGSALAHFGASASDQLKASVLSLQKTGNNAIDAVGWSRQLCLSGIEAGGEAQVEGLKAAKESLLTKFYAIIEAFHQTSHGIQGLRHVTSCLSNDTNHVSGIIDSLKTKVTTDNPAALNAISEIYSDFKSTRMVLLKQEAIDSVNVMVEGLSSTIIEIAKAISIGQNALKKAKQIGLTDKNSAMAVAREGIKEARNKILDASSEGFLAMGAAGALNGEKVTKELIPAVIKTEEGRITAYTNAELAEKILDVGLQGVEDTAEQGFRAAEQILKAGEQALYTEFIDAAKLAFDVFKRI